MTPRFAQHLEDDIECALLAHGPDACGADGSAVAEPVAEYGDALPGGYHRRGWTADYDRSLLDSGDVIDFIYATQAKEWGKLQQHHGAEVKESSSPALRGRSKGAARSIAAKGIKDSG